MTQAARPVARIVVVGGGAGGLELAIGLARLTRPGRRAQVTLVDRRPTHIWKPRLHELAVGRLVAAEEAAGFAAQGRRHGFDFVLGEAARLDPVSREVHLAPMAYPADTSRGRPDAEMMLPARTLGYDVAVLALGSTINDFGVPGVVEACHTLDSPHEAERLHRALLACAARVAAGVQPRVSVAIIGAGTTGVELAAELRNAAATLSQYRSLLTPEQLDIRLLEMAERPLPTSPRAMSDYAEAKLVEQRVETQFSAKVVRVGDGAIELQDGTTVQADLIVWTSGVKAKQLAEPIGGLAYGSNGRMAVDASLRLLGADGEVVEGIYGLGDCAAAPLPGGAVVGPTAQAAHQEAALLARSIARQLHGRPALSFHFRDRGALVSLGEGSAVGDVPTPLPSRRVRVSGVGAKLAYAALYEAHLVQLHGVVRTGALAVSAALRRSVQPKIKLFW